MIDLLANRWRKGSCDSSPEQPEFQAEREERLRTEDSLRWSEEMFRLLVEGVQDYAIFMLDPGGHVASWNLGAERIKGYRADEVIGEHFSRFYPPEATERRWPQHELEVAAAEGRFEDEGWRVRKDGSLFWANVTITAVFDGSGELRGFSKVTRDLTERKRGEEALQQGRNQLEERVRLRTAELTQANEALKAEIAEREAAEKALRASEERYRQLVLALPVPVYTTDREGRITLFNAAAAELWGRRPEIGKEMWCGSSRMFRPDGTPLAHDDCPMAIALREGRPVRGEEIFVERPDGRRAYVLPHPEPLRDAQGEIIGAVNMLVDITDRKRTEEELATADRRKNEFLATLAHELRNPLAPIRHGLELLRMADHDPEMRRQARGVMERQLGQMVRLVDDLLDVARITNHKLHLRKQRLELAAALQAAVETIRPIIEECGHQLTVALPPHPVYVDGDLTRLAQVFTNLLNNAAKYTEKGGRIRLTAERQGGEAVVSVRDNGIGITAEHLPHLFEIFSQAMPALERSEGGLGIGLSLVRGVVELHGGTVEARSAGVGKGSEFIVRLPAAAGPPAPARLAAREIAGAAAGPRHRILIVDDNRDSADSLGVLLELSGYEVSTAHDGAEAVQLAESFRPDVVLLDIGMPNVNGYEAARRIRRQPWGTKMILIAVTGWGQDEDKRRALQAGFDHHLIKPLDPAALRKLLASVVD